MTHTPRHRTGAGEHRRVLLLIAMGMLALLLGVLVYAADRDPSHSLLFPALPFSLLGVSFGPAAAWLPSLLHTLAFGLLSAAAFPACAPAAHAAPLAWAAVNIVFELGQRGGIGADLAAALFDPASPSPILRALGMYFTQGRFDPRDVAAAIVGASLALVMLRWLDRTSGGSRESHPVRASST